jgi:hypothetical protein
MRRVFVSTLVAGGMLVAGSGAWAETGATSAAWIHVRVEEPRKESKVNVNLPLSVVEAVLSAAPETVSSKGHIHLHEGGRDLSVSDLRRVWKELRASGETEIVSVEQKDQVVKVSKHGDRVQILVENPSEKETVHVEVPVAMVDALLAGEGSELNIRAALAELQKLRGDLVQVKDADSTVRIWIDERN